MKYILLAILAIAHFLAGAQSDTLMVNVLVSNQITGAPIDAVMGWYLPESVKYDSTGRYSILIAGDREEILTITKAGYFDSEVVIDYETVKQNALAQVELQPKIPQLHLAVAHEFEKPLTSRVTLYTLGDSTEIFNEEVRVSPYTIDLEYNRIFILQVQASGHFPFMDTIDLEHVYDGRVREKKIRLVGLKEGSKFVLSKGFEMYNADLTDYAKLLLSGIERTLIEHPKMILEITAYADEGDTAASDAELLRRRAMVVKDYLRENGANPVQLVVRDVAKSKSQDRKHDRNIELKIIKLVQ